jgi:uncharacterized protein YkwD
MGRALILVLVAMLGLAQAAPPDPPLSSGQSEILRLLNQARAEHGLGQLVYDSNLAAAAQKHTELMVQRHELSHQFSGEAALVNRLADAGVHLDSAAENVAESDSPQDAHTEWMLSPGHRANILNPAYNAVGIGIVSAGDARYFFTEDFAHRVPVFTSEQLSAKILNELNQLRSKANLPALQSVPISMLQHEACREDVNARGIGQAYASAGWVVVFSASDPDYLAPDMKKIARKSEAHGVALGACYPDSDHGGFAQFRVVAVFFRKTGS